MASPHPEPALVQPSGDWLDTLRGLAATAVVFYHLNEPVDAYQRSYSVVMKLGYLGVSVFFVLSGYLIVSTALKRPDVGGFARRRWWRIYPPYLASLAVVLAVIVIRKLTTGINDVRPLPAGWPAWLATLTLTTDPVTAVPRINWIYWSLSCEVAFYLFIGLFLFRRARYLPLAIAVMTWAALLPGVPMGLRFFTDHWWQFAVGATLAIGVRRPISWAILAAGALSSVLDHQYRDGAVTAATWLSILWSQSSSGQWLNRDPLFSRVGIISYSLYLIHVPLGIYLVLPHLPPAWLRRFPTHLASDVLVYAVCLGAAWLFWKTVEMPAHRYGKRVKQAR